MMTKHRLGRLITACATAFLLLGLTSTAGADQLKMSGGWLQQRGAVNIPAWVVALGDLNKSLFGLNDPTIPGRGFVTVTPQVTGPAAVQIPPHLFQLDTTRAIPLQAVVGGDVVQLTTTFSFNGPNLTGVLQQTGTTARLAANFSYCPGASNNPSCASNLPGGNDGTKPGRVTYTAGPNRFGGTMGMLIQGGGSTAVNIGGSPPRLRVDVIAGAGSQEVGLAYGFTSSVVLQSGVVFSTFTLTPNGLVGGIGAQTATLTPDVNINTGFPWTTGTVMVSEPGGVNNPAETYTMTGSDNRTQNGRGTLSLVAGGLSHRTVAGQTFVSVDKVSMDIASGQLTPSLSPTGLTAIASLMLIGGGYVLRKRL